MDTLDLTDEATEAAVGAAPEAPQVDAEAPPLLIEELTIDGMCGVY